VPGPLLFDTTVFATAPGAFADIRLRACLGGTNTPDRRPAAGSTRSAAVEAARGEITVMELEAQRIGNPGRLRNAEDFTAASEPLASKLSPGDEVSSKLDPSALVDGEHVHGGPPDGGETDNHRPADFKVLVPELAPGVKKALKASGLGIDAGEIWPLEQIAPLTRNTKVVWVVCPAVLRRDNMLDVEGYKRLRCLGQMAIFALLQSSTTNKPSRCRVHQSFGCRARTERA